MNKKTISLILGGLLILAFFLPYINVAGLFKISGFDIVAGGKDMSGEKGSLERFVLLLAPLAGVLLILGGINGDKSILPRPVLGILALAGTLYPIIRGLMESKGEGMSQILSFLGIGFWISLIASIAIFAIPALAPDKPKS
jgi:hypothetical protein